MPLVVAGLAGALLIAMLFLIAFRRLLAPSGGPRDARLAQPFHPEFYRPMERLLRNEDVEFLRSQAGYDPAMERRLRRERREAFRGYLRHLRHDFTRLHRAARFAVAHGSVDRPDLATALLRQSLRFWTLMAGAEIAVQLSRFGVSGPASRLQALIDAAHWMQAQAGALEAPSAA